jgi:hypothetical protein
LVTAKKLLIVKDSIFESESFRSRNDGKRMRCLRSMSAAVVLQQTKVLKRRSRRVLCDHFEEIRLLTA